MDGFFSSPGRQADSSSEVHPSGKMFRAVDGRNIASPRYGTRKSRAYGNMLKDDVGGTLRGTSREEPHTTSGSSSTRGTAYALPSKAVSTSNLHHDLPLVMYRKNPAIVNSQPSLAVLERGQAGGSRKPRPPSFVQALETTDSIEQLSLLGVGRAPPPVPPGVAVIGRGDHRRENHKAAASGGQFGEISV